MPGQRGSGTLGAMLGDRGNAGRGWAAAGPDTEATGMTDDGRTTRPGVSLIDLPESAYLDARGKRWTCDRGFRLDEGECILGS